MLGGSALRLGRDGYLEGCLLARTCRQLSEKHTLLTVFVKAFKNMSILYHVRAKKSNVFLHRTKYFLRNQKTIDKPVNLCLNVSNMKKTIPILSLLLLIFLSGCTTVIADNTVKDDDKEEEEQCGK